jgi:4-hydroxy-tetrahydrodipicolinate reductase
MNIALIGYGKMGRAIEEIALQRGHTIGLRIDSKSENWSEKLKSIDVAIEFTRPDVAVSNFKHLLRNNIPTVTGTTGWYSEYSSIHDEINSNNGTFLAATNFSIGVNLFFAVNEYLAKIMNTQDDYAVHVKEIHHIQKFDAPSGTAISLAEQILQNNSLKKEWQCFESEIPAQLSQNILPIEAQRKEGVPGTHTITYASDIDSIEFTHTAHNRKGFALGAVLAAEFIFNKKGIFTMKNVLNIQQ